MMLESINIIPWRHSSAHHFDELVNGLDEEMMSIFF